MGKTYAFAVSAVQDALCRYLPHWFPPHAVRRLRIDEIIWLVEVAESCKRVAHLLCRCLLLFYKDLIEFFDHNAS